MKSYTEYFQAREEAKSKREEMQMQCGDEEAERRGAVDQGNENGNGNGENGSRSDESTGGRIKRFFCL